MAHYSISDLEKLSGIKAHTLRVWEKRYDIFSPARTDTNIRFYTDEDLRKLLNISILNKHGMKISQIADLTHETICQQVQELFSKDDECIIKELIGDMIVLNEDAFHDKSDNYINEHGMESFMLQLVYPFMERIGILWMTGAINPAQEHFISNIIRQKLIVSIDRERKPYNPAKGTFLLFLPENELHEIGILFYYYMIASRGFNVIYLGQSVPYEDLSRVIETRKTDYVLTSIVSPIPEDEIYAYFDKMSPEFGSRHIFITGMQTANISPRWANVTALRKGSDLLPVLEHLS